jgi:cytochrome bd-type quinol oxidase subunit 2
VTLSQSVPLAQELIAAAVLGVMLGWPVAGVAFLPLALLVLLSPQLARSFVLLATLVAALLAAVAGTDWFFYGRRTVRLPGAPVARARPLAFLWSAIVSQCSVPCISFCSVLSNASACRAVTHACLEGDLAAAHHS